MLLPVCRINAHENQSDDFSVLVLSLKVYSLSSLNLLKYELPTRNPFKSLAVFIFQRVSNEYSRNNHIAITYYLKATLQIW